jgi:hypothetical protein
VKTRDLAREMRYAYAAMRVAEAEELIRAGIPAHIIDLYQMIGVTRIRLAGELYEPEPEGGRAFISPILAHLPDTPESSDPWAFARFGSLVDLIAWDPAHPHKWALRTGAASWLGCIPPQYIEPEPVRIWRSPLAWFRSDCTGLALVTRERPEAYRLLANLRGGIIAEDHHHAAEILDVLQHPWPAPRVSVAPSQQRQVRRAA